MVQDLALGPSEERPCQGAHPVEPVPGRSGHMGRTSYGLLTGGCRRPWPSLTPDPSCKVACPALPGLGSQQGCRQVAPLPSHSHVPTVPGAQSPKSHCGVQARPATHPGTPTPDIPSPLRRDRLPWAGSHLPHPGPRGPAPCTGSARHSAHPGLESRVCKARLSTQ